jgi:hypothetical protein
MSPPTLSPSDLASMQRIWEATNTLAQSQTLSPEMALRFEEVRDASETLLSAVGVSPRLDDQIRQFNRLVTAFRKELDPKPTAPTSKPAATTPAAKLPAKKFGLC